MVLQPINVGVVGCGYVMIKVRMGVVCVLEAILECPFFFRKSIWGALLMV